MEQLERLQRDRYEQFPWCLPVPPGLQEVIALAPPPPLPPGTAPLVAISATADWLGAVVAEATLIPGAKLAAEVGLGPTALQAWDNAWTALDTVPIRWKSLGLRHLHLSVRKVWEKTRHGQVASGSSVLECSVDGASFGLAFALAQVSWLIDKPLPDDVIASATIRYDGAVGPVGEMERKLGHAQRCGNTLRRFFVAVDQELEDISPQRLEIVRVATLEQAVMNLWPELLEEWRRLGSDDEQRKAKIQQLFHLACGPRVSVRRWLPVAKSAGEALTHWQAWLTEDERHRLAFVQAVARRHDANEGALSVEHLHWLRRHCPEPIRTELIAHALQQCADTGTPDFADLEGFVTPVIGKADLELQPAELKVLGALARLRAVQRQGKEALYFARRAAEQWRERGDHGNASYSVCTWLVMAGLLGLSDELAQAKLAAEWAQQGGAAGSVYLLLALGRGASALATPEGLATARSHLWAILQAQHSQADADVRAIAARYLLAARPSSEQKAACLAELGFEVGGVDVVATAAATPAAVLAQLDAMLAIGANAGGLADLVEALQKMAPGICVHLMRDVKPEDQAAALARWYPY